MRRGGRFLFVLGCLLVMGSLGILLTNHLLAQQAQKANAEVVQIMEEILPEKWEGSMESRLDMAMPVLEIGRKDYAALVDIPALGLTLPVKDRWEGERAFACPRRFCGTVYDGSLVIGGADQPGQFGGLANLPLGTVVTITDMSGAVFSYAVDRIERTSSASAEILTDPDADLTLFGRNTYGLEYILLRCVVK